MSSYKKDMVSYLSSHPECFDELVTLTFTQKDKLSWRAAWMLFSFMKDNDPRLHKHLKNIINTIPCTNESLQREMLKIVSRMKVNEELEGVLFDHCISIWEKIGKSPSVRYTAFKTVMRIAEKYPELTSEIEFFAQEHYMESLSPAIRRILTKEVNEFCRKNSASQ